LSPGLRRARTGVHACTRATLFVRTRAQTRTRRRGSTSAAKTGWLTTDRRARLGKRHAHVGEGGGTCKKLHPSLARWPASPAAAARWRGAGDMFLPRLEGRGVHKGQGVLVLTLVATGRSTGIGGVRWRGSSAGRKTKTTAGDDVEVVEAGALEDGGSGSSHGRLRSSRRTAFPRAPSNPSFFPLTYPSPPASRWAVRGVDSPQRRLGLGEPWGSRRRLLIAAGGAGARGWPECAGGRGVRRDGEATAGAPRFGFGRQPKW
jgi:hypothetical protein